LLLLPKLIKEKGIKFFIAEMKGEATVNTTQLLPVREAKKSLQINQKFDEIITLAHFILKAIFTNREINEPKIILKGSQSLYIA
jgi:hypothetical protein